jgi:lysozyme
VNNVLANNVLENNALVIAVGLIKEFEGLRLEAYICPAGVWTIGYGTTDGIKQGMKISLEEAEDLLANECQRFYNGVLEEVGNICNERQIGALISFVYNVGVGAFEGSTLLKVIKKNPNDVHIKNEFMRWVFANGKMMRGIERRRKAEAEVYFS